MAKKKKPKNKVPSKKYKNYSIEGNKVSRKNMCPKCGPPTIMGEHKDRLYCGSCKYVEYKSKDKK